jgi:hypothetical protein
LCLGRLLFRQANSIKQRQRAKSYSQGSKLSRPINSYCNAPRLSNELTAKASRVSNVNKVSSMITI